MDINNLHNKIFETEADYTSAKSSLNKPSVSYVEETRDVKFDQVKDIGEFVDLGLPSGLKWAKCNLGAETETDYGKYYIWGDVEGRTADEISSKPCNWAHAPFNNGSSEFDETYFNAHKSEWLDGDVLKPQYDAVYQATGGVAHMPTEADWNELLENTTNTWTSINGINGRKFTSKTDSNKYIFVPAAGGGNGSSITYVGGDGYVWSSSLSASYPDSAWRLYFYSSNCRMSYNTRYVGFSVRGVRS